MITIDGHYFFLPYFIIIIILKEKIIPFSLKKDHERKRSYITEQKVIRKL
jgi:hypothetical protein